MIRGEPTSSDCLRTICSFFGTCPVVLERFEWRMVGSMDRCDGRPVRFVLREVDGLPRHDSVRHAEPVSGQDPDGTDLAAWRPGSRGRGARGRRRQGKQCGPGAPAAGTNRPACDVSGRLGRRPLWSLLRQDDGLDPIIVPTAAPTRVILTVRTDSTTEQTAFFDPDPAIEPAEADALIDRVEEALSTNGVSALTLSGSSPSAATHGVYSDLISLAQARRIPVFLDTYGPALEAIWGFWPSAIQLNRKEAAGPLRKQAGTDKDVLGLLENGTATEWSAAS